MQLTSFSDFGLRSLMYMATLAENELTSITQVSSTFNISRNHMIKIINILSRKGFVKAIRGKKGGIRLAMPADQIRIGQVIKAIEPLEVIKCGEEFCHVTSACRLKNIIYYALGLFLEELDKYTLADLVDNNEHLYKLLQTKSL